MINTILLPKPMLHPDALPENVCSQATQACSNCGLIPAVLLIGILLIFLIIAGCKWADKRADKK